jgi:hypothetical protein
MGRVADTISLDCGQQGGGNLMVQIHEQRTITASPERVYAWLLEPANLTVSPYARGGGKVVELVTAPLVRSFAFRAILTGCAKALES